jgi:peroxidase
VSCADVVALAARDAYEVPTGRRDGVVSSAIEARLPSPSASFAEALSTFRNIGLSLLDLTALLDTVNLLLSYSSILDKFL